MAPDPAASSAVIESAPIDSGAADLDLDGRLAFMRLDAAACARLRSLQGMLNQALPAAAAAFYDHAGRSPHLAGLLGGADNIARLRRAQADHWGRLFSGDFDAAYVARALAVGRAHERIGLEPRWYVGAYCLIVERLAAAVAARHGAKPALAEDLAVMLRAAFLDMELAVSTYIASGEDSRIHAEMLAVSEVLDRELQMAVGEVSAQAERLADGADTLTRMAGRVRGMTEAVGQAVAGTAQDVQTVASATGELEASSRAIADQVDRASGASADAVRQAEATSQTVRALSEATGRINDVVKLVRSIASQTKLLALNATIEAARAGEAGKGFAVVATEVKSLARQTEDAIASVSAQAEAIGRATADAARMVEAIAGSIGGVSTIAGDVASATEQQLHATSEIMRSVGRVAENTGAVSVRTGDLMSEAEGAAGTADQFKTLAAHMSGGIGDLHRRLTVILRSSHAGNRRREEREPTALPFAVRSADWTAQGHTSDLSPRGALLAVKADEGLVGRTAEVEIDGIGTIPSKIMAVSGLGIHVQFTGLGEGHAAAIHRILNEARAFDRVYVAKATEVAREVAEAFERALATGRFREEDLFDTVYREIPGTDPRQYQCGSNGITDAVLPAIVDRVKDTDPRIVFCLGTDRNGYIGTHNRDYSKPQRPGDPVWNAANCRNRRIFEDRAGILAARNTQPHIVQAYLRDMGGGRTVMLKEIDVPIRVRGKHWGAIRLAVTPR